MNPGNDSPRFNRDFEAWEVVRLHPVKISNEDYFFPSENLSTYVLLQNERLPENMGLTIQMIPLMEEFNGAVRVYDGYTRRNSSYSWSVQLDVVRRNIDFTPGAYGFLQVSDRLRGKGLGSWVFSNLIRWAKQQHPNLGVRSLRLANTEIATEEDRDRRNAFYRNFNFTLIFEDREQREGYAKAGMVRDLCEHRNLGKIEPVQLESFRQEWIVRLPKLLHYLNNVGFPL